MTQEKHSVLIFRLHSFTVRGRISREDAKKVSEVTEDMVLWGKNEIFYSGVRYIAEPNQENIFEQTYDEAQK